MALCKPTYWSKPLTYDGQSFAQVQFWTSTTINQYQNRPLINALPKSVHLNPMTQPKDHDYTHTGYGELCYWAVAAAAVPLKFSTCFLRDNVPISRLSNANTLLHCLKVANPLTSLLSKAVIAHNFSQMSDLTTGCRPDGGLIAKHLKLASTLPPLF